jgi:hypothetical protein
VLYSVGVVTCPFRVVFWLAALAARGAPVAINDELAELARTCVVAWRDVVAQA